MTEPTHNRIKQIKFSLTADGGTATQYECQIRSWTLTPPQDDGDTIYTQCPDGEFVEDVDPNWTLAITFLSDWTDGGLSDFLALNAGDAADFVLDHHPDIADQHVQWSGTVKLKAPPAGGDARAREEQTVTMKCVGEPSYSRPAGTG